MAEVIVTKTLRTARATTIAFAAIVNSNEPGYKHV